MIALATVMLLAAPAAPAPAPDSAAQAAWRACVDRTTTNTDWAQCGGKYVAQADAALNAEWKRLNATVSGKTKADLLAEQRAWLAYRNSACKFYANGDWGREGQVLHYPGCVAGVIQRRTAELADYRKFAGPK